MTELGEKRLVLSTIDLFVTRSEFIAERIRSTKPGSKDAALANDMLVVSHLIKQFVEHLPDGVLVERCLVAGYAALKFEWEEGATRNDKAEAQQLVDQMRRLELSISHLPAVITKLAAPFSSTDSVGLIGGLAPRTSFSFH